MVVLGFLIVIAAILLGLGVALSTSSSASIEGFGLDVDTTAAAVYFAGAATAIMLVIGLWLMKSGTARIYRHRREVRALRRQSEAAPAATEPGSTPPSAMPPDAGRHADPSDEDEVPSSPAPTQERKATSPPPR
jgi:hypothetical protein